MKILIQIILFLLTTTSAFASTPVTAISSSPEFTYEIQNYPHIEKDISNLLTTFDEFFSSRELEQITLPEGFSKTKTSLSSVNRIYGGNLGKTVVFVKAGVIPSAALATNKPVQIADGFLQHFKRNNGLVVAVFVRTQNWENASEIFSNLKTQFVTSFNPGRNSHGLIQSLSNEFIGAAYAQDNPPCDPKLKTTQGSLDKLAVVADSMARGIRPIDHITGCAMSAIKGVWDGSAGAVVGGVKGVGEFLMSPIESGKKFWESTTKLWNVTNQFFGDFENEARKLYPAFDSLDPLLKTKLACEVIGTIGGGVLLSYATVGALAGSASTAILLKIKTAISTALNSVKYSGAKKALVASSVKIEKIELDLHKNLFSIERGTAATSLIDNQKVLDGLKGMSISTKVSRRKIGLSDDEIQQLFRQIEDHPVVSLANVHNYEKFSPGMGYCFGRATAAHIKALMNGADKSSIRKVWALGDLQTGSAKWRYHVTTIVRDTKGEWHAIDPIMGKVMPIDKWYKEMKKYDSSGNMRIFDTEPKRFGPDGSGKYSRRSLNNKGYENYFHDLMNSFRAETNELISLRKAAH